MSKKTLLLLLLLLPCICKAEEYYEDTHIFAEQVGSNNYNFRLGISYVNKHIGNGYYYSFDHLYFRVIEDENTWRLAFPLLLFEVSFIGMMFDEVGPNSDRPRTLFDPGWGRGAVISTLPFMLMNPTLGFRATEILRLGVGYNTDFIIASPFKSEARLQIYFAPKVQMGFLIAKKYLLTATLSYQVADCFATKRGFHIGLSFTTSGYKWDQEQDFYPRVYNRSEHRIAIRAISKKNGEKVGDANYIRSHTRKRLYPIEQELEWKTMIERENGIIIQAFPAGPDGNRTLPSDFLDKITPLKEWQVPDWESLERAKGDYYYP